MQVKQMTPTISIVVPVYQVEPYLKKSVESILNQTYQNIEVILVCDFSTDRCGEICDDFAKKDLRVRVIHKEHYGLSAARNAGLDMASGEYVGFVDSDDWIEPDMYAYLMDGVRKTGASISICPFWEEYPRSSRVVGQGWDTLLDHRQAMLMLITSNRITNTVWNKLYRRSLFDGVRFPVGRLSEDNATAYRLFDKADSVCILSSPKYHYLINPRGLMRAKNLNRELDFWKAANERYDTLLPKYPEWEDPLKVDIMQAIMNVWSLMWDLGGAARREYAGELRQMALYARTNCQDALQWCHFGLTGRIRTRLTQYDCGWSFWLCRILKRLSYIRCGG